MTRRKMRAVLGSLLATIALLGVHVFAGEVETYDRARAMLGSDPEAAAAMLDRLARHGDPLSQFHLGSMLLSGQQIPQNRPLGLAYMKLAAANEFVRIRNGRATVDSEFTARARAVVQKYESELSGPELLAADGHVATIEAERQKDDDVARMKVQAEIRPYTSETIARSRPGIVFVEEVVQIAVRPIAGEGLPVQFGCAIERRGRGCRDAPQTAATNHCTGRIVSSDDPANRHGSDARTPLPHKPYGMRADGPGVAIVVAHVDRSGFVCSAVVAATAGQPQLDAAVLDAVRQWKLVPARKQGIPVESLERFGIGFADGP